MKGGKEADTLEIKGRQESMRQEGDRSTGGRTAAVETAGTTCYQHLAGAGMLQSLKPLALPEQTSPTAGLQTGELKTHQIKKCKNVLINFPFIIRFFEVGFILLWLQRISCF